MFDFHCYVVSEGNISIEALTLYRSPENPRFWHSPQSSDWSKQSLAGPSTNTMMSSRRLINKVAIVTGSSTGIGRAIALAFAAEQAHVVCADLTPYAPPKQEGKASVPTHELIRQRAEGEIKPEAMFVHTDVGVEGDVVSCVGEAIKKLGRLDVYVVPLPAYWFLLSSKHY